ncbi:MAG: hypothetical protein KDD50_01290 [Bdellovibrionales bacterium]|nr:hypothetical protein [Bdellovibrionales bacterium]
MSSQKLINVLIGHRGVGKSSFLKRIKKYYDEQIQNVHVYDLDEEIENSEGSITKIFLEKGEDYFRKLERTQFERLLELSRSRKQKTFISVGAGFNDHFDSDVNVIWVRRASDEMGRVFLNRPRLEKNITNLEEYFKRKSARDVYYSEVYDEQIVLREGKIDADDGERFFLGLIERTIPYSYTIQANSIKRLELILEQYDKWINFFEIRDDVLTQEMAKRAVEKIEQKKILYSIRKEKSYLQSFDLKDSIVDLALEVKSCDIKKPDIVSCHEKIEGSIDKTLKILESQNARFFKLAIPIDNFKELMIGHKWWSKDKRKRIFLPMSKNGRWSWYRSHFCFDNFLSFFKDDLNGSAMDQPLLTEIINYPRGEEEGSKGPTFFAAIMGSPLSESWTPTFQQPFFNDYDMPVYRIQMDEDELTKEVLDSLKTLGLRAAAVTSPLKKKMFQLVDDSNEFLSTNTIVYGDSWKGTNTDIFGIAELVKNVDKDSEIAVWGGGGTLNILKEAIPQAKFYSAREGAGENAPSPKYLLWAVGRNRMGESVMPPKNWQPEFVIDLNYSQSSPGMELADQYRCQYFSGEKMFFMQGEKQREFWKKYLER